MGIVIKQSLRNTVVTYLGFGVGAINILFLYTKILEDTYFALVTLILASGAIIMPLMAFGVHNTLVKFYSAQKEEQKDAFLTLMLLCPILIILPLGLLTYLFYDAIAGFLSHENALVKDYVWHIFLVGMSMAYFEVFFAWSRVQLKSVFGNFMKEVFARVGITLLLTLYYFDFITLDMFLKMVVGMYLLRTVIMKLYAYRLRWPRLNFNFPEQTKEILTYSLLIILGGSAALILLEIDKVMINQFKAIENVAYYGVAVYIATVIIVPYRAMHQITYPLTASLINKGDIFGLGELYQKSSLTLFIASGLLFLLIVLNIEELYLLLPTAYSKGFYVVLLIGMAKVFESMLGNINSILYNSKYYKTVLMFGVLLAMTTIVLNLWLIPLFGIEGAALASFSALFIFNLLKMVFVKLKFDMLPFTKDTVKVALLIFFLAFLFAYLRFYFHPIINIGIKSMLIIAMYLGILYRFNISDDVSAIMNKFLKRKP